MSSPGEAGKRKDSEATSSDQNKNQQVEVSAEATPTVDLVASTDSVAQPRESLIRAEGDDDTTVKAVETCKTQARARKDSVEETDTVASAAACKSPEWPEFSLKSQGQADCSFMYKETQK